MLELVRFLILNYQYYSNFFLYFYRYKVVFEYENQGSKDRIKSQCSSNNSVSKQQTNHYTAYRFSYTNTELYELMIIAEEWIKDFSKHVSIFPDENPHKLIHINH